MTPKSKVWSPRRMGRFSLNMRKNYNIAMVPTRT